MWDRVGNSVSPLGGRIAHRMPSKVERGLMIHEYSLIKIMSMKETRNEIERIIRLKTLRTVLKLFYKEIYAFKYAKSPLYIIDDFSKIQSVSKFALKIS